MAKRKKTAKTPDFVVTSRVKEFLHASGYRADGDLISELNTVVKHKLENGMDRADDNRRATVRPSDL